MRDRSAHNSSGGRRIAGPSRKTSSRATSRTTPRHKKQYCSSTRQSSATAVWLVGCLVAGVGSWCLQPSAAATSGPHADALRQLFVDTGGANGGWAVASGWQADGGDPCADEWSGVTCAADGTVTHLELDNNGLSGSIDAVAGLTSLTHLSLRSNTLRGGIGAVASLAELTSLSLESNELSGSIDPLEGLTNLQYLFLNNNQFSGGVGALSGLTRLQRVNAGDNSLLHGTVDVSQLTSLVVLRVAGTQVSQLMSHRPLSADFSSFDVSDSSITSLPEGVFTLCGDTIESVLMDGAAFPKPCPAGQAARAAPVSDAHYCERNQSLGLQAFYEGTGGAGWSSSVGWSSAASSGVWDPCDSGAVVGDSTWTGVTCGDGELSGRVTQLQLYDNGLLGGLPGDALASLSSLDYLHLAENQLTGSIDALAGLTRLTYLNVGDNQLSGSIDAVAGLTRLAYVNMRENQFEGGIAATAGLVGLTELFLRGNALTGSIDAVASLTRITHLYLHENQFSGSIDAVGGLGSLAYLHLGSNQLSGGIDAVAGLAGAVHLNLGHNALNGSIDAVAGLTGLQHLALSNNEFTDGLDALSGLNNLTHLYLYSNQFSGGAEALAGLTNLVQVSLYQNPLLRGALDLSLLTSLTVLRISGTGFSEIVGHRPLPAAFDDLDISGTTISSLPEGVFTLCGDTITSVAMEAANICLAGQVMRTAPVSDTFYCERSQSLGLQALYEGTGGAGWLSTAGWASAASSGDWDPCDAGAVVGDSSWTGITCGEGELAGRVTQLRLASNGLSGNLPGGALASLSSLDYLDLAHNQLTGNIDALAGLTRLTYLHLGSNELSGNIDAVVDLTRMSYLNLAANDFSGGIETVERLTSLVQLLLQGNQLNGSIDAVAALSSLEYLNLSGNQFAGIIDAVSGLTSLSSLHLTDNDLNGGIGAVAGLNSLTHLYLSANELSGGIDAVAGLTSVERLYLSHNQFSGEIAAIAGLHDLDHLGLDFNQLGGKIDAVAAVTRLVYLNLRHNNFVGNIDAVASLTLLTHLYIDDNALSGSIEAVSGFTSVTRLYAGNNQINGTIEALTALTYLEQVSLSNNQLSGDIDSLSELTSITTIYIQDNDLIHGNLDISKWPLLTAIDIARTGISQVSGHAPLPSSFLELGISGTSITSLPEGMFTLCAGTITTVTMDGAAFPTPCPAGQTARVAPVSATHYCERNQSLGLQALYEGTGGVGWTSAAGWASAASSGVWDPCDAGAVVGDSGWTGVTCGDGEFAGRVTQLQLGGNHLVGSFPGGALASLSSLETLTLASNVLTGSIDALAGLARLTYLSLGNDQLSGSIDAVAQLTHLTFLSLGNNLFSGTIDAVAGLTELIYLNLHRNAFVGGIAATSGLVRLTELYLHDNELTGSIDAVAGLASLTRLYLHENKFTGSISVVARLANLEHLYLSNNDLNGRIDAVAGLDSLSQLYLNSNEFGGGITAVVGLTGLTHLYLSNNLLGGGLDALAGLTDLVHLCLDDNEFSGAVDAVQGLTNLLYLDVSGNTLLRGSLDASQLTALTVLTVAGTEISHIAGHRPLSASLLVFDISGTTVSSLPEGVFSLCRDTITSVAIVDTPFPNPCPAGQTAREAPVSDAHYCERNQSLGLQAFYEGTGGEGWGSAAGWASAALTGVWDPCDAGAVVGDSSWRGVTCGDGEFAGRVTQLHLGGNNLVGELPGDALASLSSLSVLSLSLNQLSGSIDASAALARLTLLSVASNSLTGSIDAVQGLTSLESLDLRSNQLSGGIDAVAGLTQLTYLDLSSNQFVGGINATAGLVRLTELYLDTNSFSGSIDALAGLSSLSRLFVQYNQLSGELNVLAGLTSATVLYLHHNQFVGSVESVAGLTGLVHLYVNNNKLVGTIDVLGGLTNLLHLVIYSNQLSGSIDALASLTKLEHLYAYENQFSGDIGAVSSLTSLKGLDLHDNQFSGSVEALTGLSSLVAVDLSQNLLLRGAFDVSRFMSLSVLQVSGTGVSQLAGHGPLPAAFDVLDIADTSISSLPEGVFTLCRDTITTVVMGGAAFPNPCPAGQTARVAPVSDAHYCERNQSLGLQAFYEGTGGEGWGSAAGWASAALSGVWDPCDAGAVVGDSSWRGVTCGDGEFAGRVTQLLLHNNGLSGTLPGGALASLSSLDYMDLSHNQLTGSIDDLAGLTQLAYLYLHENQLSGSIDELAALRRLTILYLNNNDFIGNIDAVAQLTSLNMLYLHYNRFSGTMEAVAGLTNLTRLYLQFNSFSGSMDAVAGLTGLTRLYLNNNEFSGSIDTVANLTGLTVLFINTNQFSGSIDAVAGLTKLLYLYLNNNDFSGGIDAVAGLTKLLYLFVDDNAFSGVIDAVEGLTRLVYFYAGHNDLSGSIDAVAGLTSLTRLYLHHNDFTGGIDAVAQLTQLEKLRLSSNLLSGSIDALASLGVLEHLDLNINLLSGGIDAVASLTSLTYLNLGSNELSGSLEAVAGLSGLTYLNLGINDFSGGIDVAMELAGLRQLYFHGNRLSGSLPVLQLVESELREFKAADNDLSALGTDSNEFTAWCASLAVCEVDEPQAGAVLAQAGALSALAVWLGNVTGEEPSGWSVDEGDPCQLPWPGVVCDWQGRVRHVGLPDVNATDFDDEDALLPVDVLRLGDARELLLPYSAAWPPEALYVASDPPEAQQSSSTSVELATFGGVVDLADVWLQWSATNDTQRKVQGATAANASQLQAGAATIELDVSEASRWPHGAAVDATVELHARLASDEPGFRSTPRLPTDRTLLSWRVDTLPPAAALAVAPPPVVASRAVEVVFGCSEAGCRYQYSLDAGATWASASSNGGGDVVEPDAAAAAFSRRTHFESAPPHVTPDSTARFVMALGADIGGFQFSRDEGVTWQHTASEVIELEALQAGWHSLVVRALQRGTDVPDTEPVAHSWLVEPSHAPLPPMGLRIASGPPAVTPVATASFTFHTAHTHSLLEYRIDGGPWHPTIPSMVVGPVSVGEHVLELRGTSLERGGAGLNEYVEAPAAWRWTYQPADSGTRLELARDGDHSLMARATDPAGNLGPASAAYAFRVDTVPPTTTARVVLDTQSPTAWPSSASGISGPPPEGGAELLVVDRDRVNVTLGAADGAAHAQRCLNCVVTCAVVSCSHLNGSLASPVPCGDVALDDVPVDDFVLHTVRIGADVDDGALQLAFVARDEAGNVDASPVAVTVLLDTEPPSMREADVVNARRIVDGVRVVNSSTVGLMVSCADSAGVGCAFSLQTTPDIGAAVQHAPREGTPAPTDATLTLMDVPDGAYTLQVTAWDAAGHRSDANASVLARIDTTPPAAAGLAVADAQLRARAAAGLPVNTTAVMVDAMAAQVPGGGGEAGVDALLEGFVVCVDAVLAAEGDDGWTTAPVDLTALPSEACASPPHAGSYTALPAAFTAPSEVNDVSGDGDALRDDGLGVRATLRAKGLASGAWRVSVWPVDAAGNVALQPASVALSVDTKPPRLSLSSTAPRSGALITASMAVELPVNASEGRCTLLADIDGAEDGGPSSSSGTRVMLALGTGARDGEHEARVWAVDEAGNRALQPLHWRWWLDTTAPGVDTRDLAAALSGGTTISAAMASNSSSPTVAARCVESDPAAAAPGATCSLAYTLDGNEGGAVTAASGEPVALPALTDGPHVLHVSAHDGVGNEDARNATDVWWVTDTEAPVVDSVELPRHTNSPAVDVPLTCVDRSLCTLHVRVTGRRVTDGCVAPDALVTQGDDSGDAAVDSGAAAQWEPLAPDSWVLAAAGGGNSALDGSAVLRFAYIAALRGLGDGEQRVEVRATDGAAQASAAVREAAFFVDTVPPPAPSIEVGLPALTSDRQFTWEIRVPGEALAPDGVDATQLQVEVTTPSTVTPWTRVAVAGADGGADASLLRFAHETAEEGRHVLAFRAVDAAGNVGAVTTAEWVVATSPPVTGLLARPPATSGVDYAYFEFSASLPSGVAATGPVTDALGVEVRLGTGEWEDVHCAAAAPGDVDAGDVVCTYRLAHLELGPYILSARARDSAGNVDPSPQQVSWTVALCGDGAYEVLREGGRLECAPCPEGAWCGDISRPNVTYDAVGALAGWWTSGAAPLNGSVHRYYPCRITGACKGGDGAGNRSACAVGHESRLCSLCSEGYFMRWDGCQPCPATQAASWAFLVGVAVALVASAALVFKLRSYLPMAMIKVMATGLQILASASAVYSVPWPAPVARLLDGLRVSLLEVMTLLRVSCTSPMTFYSSLALTLLVFKGVALAVVLAIAWSSVRQRQRAAEERAKGALRRAASSSTGRRARQRRQSSLAVLSGNVAATAREVRGGLDWWRVFKLLAMYLLLAYPGVSMKLLRVFNCVTLDGESWLVADMRLPCYDAAWGGFALWAAGMLVAYTAGLPVFVCVVLWRHRHQLRDPEVRGRLGFLYEEHGEHAYFGEPMELLRKLLLSSLPLFFEPGSPMQLLYALIISFGAAVAHAALKPFKQFRRAYYLQHASLAASFSLFAMGLVYQTQGLDRTSAAYEALSYLLLGVQASFVAVGLLMIGHASAARLLEELRRRDMTKLLSSTMAAAAVTARVRARRRAEEAAAPSSTPSPPVMVENPMRAKAAARPASDRKGAADSKALPELELAPMRSRGGDL